MKYVILGFTLLILSFVTASSGIMYYYKHTETNVTLKKSKTVNKKTLLSKSNHSIKNKTPKSATKKAVKTKTKIVSIDQLRNKPSVTKVNSDKQSSKIQKDDKNQISNTTDTKQTPKQNKIKSKYADKKFFVIYFAKNSHRISSKYKKLLAEFTKAHPNSRFKIFLRTADLDTKPKNKKLGRKRYEAIAEIMKKQTDAKPEHIGYYVRTPKPTDKPDKLKTRKWRRAVIKVITSKKQR